MEKNGHLDSEQIVRAVIEEGGLDEAVRRHLLECSACRAQKEELEGSLARFGEISRAQTPAIFRKPRILEQSAGVFKPVWKSRPAIGLGVALAILILLLSPLTLKRDKISMQDVVYREMLQDEKFMSEIEKLEENPLPSFYVIIGEPGEDEGDVQPPGTIKDDGLTQYGGSRDA